MSNPAGGRARSRGLGRAAPTQGEVMVLEQAHADARAARPLNAVAGERLAVCRPLYPVPGQAPARLAAQHRGRPRQRRRGVDDALHGPPLPDVLRGPAFVVRGNYLAAAIGTAVGNPWTFPFIWAGTYRLGSFMLGNRLGKLLLSSSISASAPSAPRIELSFCHDAGLAADSARRLARHLLRDRSPRRGLPHPRLAASGAASPPAAFTWCPTSVMVRKPSARSSF